MSMKNLVCSPLFACLLGSSLLAASGCDSRTSGSKTDNDGSAGTSGSGTGGNGSTDGPNGSGGGGYDGPTLGVDGSGKIPIGSAQCSDGIDNDGDGLVDYDDPECVGPLDNDESSFATGIPGDNMDACKQDCFFDGNSGMGDDHCNWQLKCDPQSHEASCPYDPSYASSHQTECSVASSQSQACIDFCRQLVPNGCDCFGCCAVPQAPQPIRLAATCTAEKFNDPSRAPPARRSPSARSRAATATSASARRRCPRTAIPAPPTAAPTPPPTPPPTSYTPPRTCTGGFVACGPGGVDPAACPSNTGCVTGCCLPIIP